MKIGQLQYPSLPPSNNQLDKTPQLSSLPKFLKPLKMSSVSNMTAVRALISALPRKELQALDKEIRGLIEASPKKTRVAAVGQKAWFAFMRHCRDTLAERFTEGMKAPEMAVVCKAIREEDQDAYTAFVEKFKAENSAPASDAEASSSEEAAPLSDAEASPSSPTKPVKRVRLSPEAKAAKEAAEAEEKAAKKAEKARAKAEKEALAAQEKEAKKAEKAEAKAKKDALAAQEKADKAAARAAKSAEKPAKSPPKVKGE